jgi:hypothetical protein
MLIYNAVSLCLYKIGLPCPCERRGSKTKEEEGYKKLDMNRYMKRGSVGGRKTEIHQESV